MTTGNLPKCNKQSVKLHYIVTFQMLHHVVRFDEKVTNFGNILQSN